jgi:syntaxin 5
MSARRRRRSNSNSKDDTGVTAAATTSGPSFCDSHATTTLSSPPMMSLSSSIMDGGCRDRTQEFRAVIMSLGSNQFQGGCTSAGPVRPSYRSEFTNIAKKISKDLANTYAKLEKLTMLAKRKSLFDDKDSEIQQLTFVIKQDLGSLNKQIAQLQELSKAQLGQNSRHKQTHANSVVVSLQSKLAAMSGNFKSVLEVRTENLKQQKSRRDEFSQSVGVTPSLPASVLNGHMGSVLLQDEAKGDHAQVVINMDGVGQRHQQLQLVDEQDSYIQTRADTMRNIEQTIVELGTIFQQLAHMVKEQEEMVQRIDSNVDSAHINIEAAHTELVKYFQRVTSNRWLMIKIFGVLIVFFIIFIIFLA